MMIKVNDGDVVFRYGKGLFSRMFREVGRRHSRYSHVGLIQLRNGIPYVIHAEACDFTGIGSVKAEKLTEFVGSEKASAWAVYRPKDGTSGHRAAMEATMLENSGTKFDNTFDSYDHTKVYCTEMVAVAYSRAGNPLGESVDPWKTVATELHIISVSSIEHSTKLTRIYEHNE